MEQLDLIGYGKIEAAIQTTDGYISFAGPNKHGRLKIIHVAVGSVGVINKFDYYYTDPEVKINCRFKTLGKFYGFMKVYGKDVPMINEEAERIDVLKLETGKIVVVLGKTSEFSKKQGRWKRKRGI